MSTIVKYKRNNGTVAVYESTSHYDPVTKQSRPVRKYLGIEDPVTGELIPSSGKRGRPAKAAALTNEGSPSGQQPDYKALYEAELENSRKKDDVIRGLRGELSALSAKQKEFEKLISSVGRLLTPFIKGEA